MNIGRNKYTILSQRSSYHLSDSRLMILNSLAERIRCHHFAIFMPSVLPVSNRAFPAGAITPLRETTFCEQPEMGTGNRLATAVHQPAFLIATANGSSTTTREHTTASADTARQKRWRALWQKQIWTQWKAQAGAQLKALLKMQWHLQWRAALMILMILLPAWAATAQPKKGLITPENLLRNWKVVIKGGTAMLMSEVPDEYIQFINHVNIPTWTAGLSTTLATKKMLSAHWEMGYQLEYMQIRGTVLEGIKNHAVQTIGLGNHFTLGYVFREAWINNPKTNYTLAYKVGGLTIDNRLIHPDNSLNGNSSFLRNLAVVTGLINEFSFNINKDWSLNATLEFNRSSDNPADIIKPHKLFYFSPNTVNNYLNISVGMSYQFGLVKNKFNNNPKNLPWYKRKR